jgi:hypothetical protein
MNARQAHRVSALAKFRRTGILRQLAPPVGFQRTRECSEMTRARHALTAMLLCCVGSATAAPGATLDIVPLFDGDFESGPGTWSEFSNHDLGLYPLVVPAGELPQGVTPHDGTHAVWLGGLFDDVSYLERSVTVPTIAPRLGAWYLISSQESSCSVDVLTVSLNGTTVDTIGLCIFNNKGWTARTVDISAFAGQTVTLRVQVSTDSSDNSNLFADTFFLETKPEVVFADGFEAPAPPPSTAGAVRH